jgi:hypothetical protein
MRPLQSSNKKKKNPINNKKINNKQTKQNKTKENKTNRRTVPTEEDKDTKNALNQQEFSSRTLNMLFIGFKISCRNSYLY